jgi:hypothetical protein
LTAGVKGALAPTAGTEGVLIVGADGGSIGDLSVLLGGKGVVIFSSFSNKFQQVLYLPVLPQAAK